MSSITDLIQEHLGDNGLAQLSQHLGIDPNTAQAAVTAALPMLVGAMAHTASQPGAAPVPPAAHAEISQQVSKSSGLDIHQAEKALLFLAPIVMAGLARKRQEGALAPTAPAAAPQPGQPAPQDQATGLGGVLGAVERIFHKES